MKYAHEILGVMRSYPNVEFRMAHLVREASAGRALTPRQMEAVRKGVKRVLDHLIETGHVQRVGGGTRAAAYRWRGLGHEVRANACQLGQVSGQLR